MGWRVGDEVLVCQSAFRMKRSRVSGAHKLIIAIPTIPRTPKVPIPVTTPARATTELKSRELRVRAFPTRGRMTSFPLRKIEMSTIPRPTAKSLRNDDLPLWSFFGPERGLIEWDKTANPDPPIKKRAWR